MTRNGDVSVGGAARFVRVDDGWVVLNLPRDPRMSPALPALVGEAVPPDDWTTGSRPVWPGRSGAEVVETGCASRSWPPRRPAQVAHARSRRVTRCAIGGERVPEPSKPRPFVVDLTALWAGPLLTSMLAAAGAQGREGRGPERRPDGARLEDRPGFFDLLNAGKECVALDFEDRDDVRAASVRLDRSRPTSWWRDPALGSWTISAIDPVALVDCGDELGVDHGPRTVRAGRCQPGGVRRRRGSGGRAVRGRATLPVFVADAVADPLAGLAGAALAAELSRRSTGGARRGSVGHRPRRGRRAHRRSPRYGEAIRRREERWEVATARPVGTRSSEPRHRTVVGSTASRLGAADQPIRSRIRSRRPAEGRANPTGMVAAR